MKKEATEEGKKTNAKKPDKKEWYLQPGAWQGIDSSHSLTLRAIDAKGPVIQNNPIIDYMGSADPSTQVVGDTLYVYPSHDAFEKSYGIGYAMFDYHVYSSGDLLDFNDRGVALKGKDISWKNYQGASHCYDPSAITVGDSTYFYFFLARNAKKNKSATMGVAVGNHPAGPFKDALGKPLLNHDEMPDHQAGSPQAFFDLNNEPWLIWGAHARCGIRKLNKNMVSFAEDADYIELTKYMPGFKEAPWMYKYNDKYYLTYTGRKDGEELGIAYAVSDSLQGPYKYMGKIMHPHNIRTHHHSIVNFHDQWYIFYHIDFNGNEYYRQACAEYLFHNEDGTIAPARHTQAGVGRKNAFHKIEAEQYFSKTGSTMKDHPKKKVKKIMRFENGNNCRYKGIVFWKAARKFCCWTDDKHTPDGKIVLLVKNRKTGEALKKSLNLNQGELSHPIAIPIGEYDVTLEYSGENPLLLDAFWFE